MPGEASGGEPKARRPLRVLVVEDSERDALLLIRELRHHGYEPAWERVETEQDLRAALVRQPWDIVLTDHNMPHFSSIAALHVVKDTGVDLPLIIVSGTIGEDVAVEAMKSGAHDYVMKGRLGRLAPAVGRELEAAETRRAVRRMEQMLRDNEARLRAALEAELARRAAPEEVGTEPTPPAVAAAHAAAAAMAPGTAGTSTLLVGGDETLRRAFREAFDPSLVNVAFAATPEEAMEQCRDGRVGVIYVDLDSSRARGIQFLRQVSTALPNARLFVLTGLSEESIVTPLWAAAKEGAVFELIRKPLGPHSIRALTKWTEPAAGRKPGAR
jgi:DNA-binding NtrC family response regulator